MKIMLWALLSLMATSAWAEEPLDDPLLDIPASVGTERAARGVLRARDQAVLSSELAGRIIEMPYTDGQNFKKGDVLVRFDCSAYQAQLNAAQAAGRQRAKSSLTRSNWQL